LYCCAVSQNSPVSDKLSEGGDCGSSDIFTEQGQKRKTFAAHQFFPGRATFSLHPEALHRRGAQPSLEPDFRDRDSI